MISRIAVWWREDPLPLRVRKSQSWALSPMRGLVDELDASDGVAPAMQCLASRVKSKKCFGAATTTYLPIQVRIPGPGEGAGVYK